MHMRACLRICARGADEYLRMVTQMFVHVGVYVRTCVYGYESLSACS